MTKSIERQGARIQQVGEEAAEQRVDNYLLKIFKGVPKSRIYQMLRKGEVRVNGGRIKPDHRLQPGDKVRLPPVQLLAEQHPVARLLPQQQAELEAAILYEDNKLLVLNKPSGLAVHGGSGISLGVIERLRLARPKDKELELVHRLDRDTSGLLLIAKKRSALRQLHALLLEGKIHKSYWALLAGSWSRDSLTCSAALQKNTLQSGERLVRVDAQGKKATTHFRVLQRYADAMLVEAQLETGRTHQIRVHASSLGTPIIGDDKYGNAEVNKAFRQLGLKRLFLHAECLRFPWQDDRMLTLHAPLSADLYAVLEQLQCTN